MLYCNYRVLDYIVSATTVVWAGGNLEEHSIEKLWNRVKGKQGGAMRQMRWPTEEQMRWTHAKAHTT